MSTTVCAWGGKAFFAFLFPVFLLVLPCASHAWNAAGHRQIAALAWEEMTPATRRQATALLRQHPDYARWRNRQRENDPDYGVFLEASVWADEIRADPRFYDEKKGSPMPRLPGFPDMRRHGGWHYRDAGGGEIDTRLAQLAHDILHGQRAAKTYALPWLLHLTGDIHQPLHTGGRNDRGGNQFHVRAPSAKREKLQTLHAYWDDLPGPSGQRGASLARRLAFLRRLPPLSSVESVGDIRRWFAESRALIARDVYPQTRGATLDANFRRRAQYLAAQRLRAAGQRLGRWLNYLL
ncbi:MAG: S1/P1 nuclease [Zoogloeaceae bacterium]|nr:S1/P1 nuclease [Zoogloeaceae bacterium]